MPRSFLITGATGFVGSHVAEACRARGDSVSAIARPGSDTEWLENLGVTILRGDFTDPALARQALESADVVVHCAAKVGDRGPVEEYRAVNVEGLRGLLEACKGRRLDRFVHMSSLGVYEPRHHYGTDESEPLPQNHVDGYTQTKVEAERLALEYHRKHGVPVVVLRPGFVYGPRDRAVLPKLLKHLAEGRVHYLGGDQRALNTIFVGNLVDAVFLAVDKPESIGQVYNLTDGERVTRQRFFEAIVNELGYPRPHQRLPRWLAALVARFLWRQIRRAGPEGKPLLTAAKYKFLLLNLDFSIEKARRELGYRPRIAFDEGMRESLAWYRTQNELPKKEMQPIAPS
jgi:nucleoside-diphosphate-sugar epimerase